MNIHQLDLNSDSFSGSPNLENRKWKFRHFGAEIWRPRKPWENTYLWNKSRRQFSYAARCFVPKIAFYQTASVWFVKNEYFMAKIDVCRSLLRSDRVIGWDIKMTSHPNSNASFINIWDRLIWRRSPNLTRSSKLAAAPNCWNNNQHASNIKYLANLIKKYWTYFRNQKLADFLVCFPPSVRVQVLWPPSWKICLRIQLSFGFWGRAVKAFDNFSWKLAWLLKTIF